MASNFSLSTLLNTSSANLVPPEKTDLIQKDADFGEDFQRALSSAEAEPVQSESPVKHPPKAAKPPAKSGNASPAERTQPAESTPPETAAAGKKAEQAQAKQDAGKPNAEEAATEETSATPAPVSEEQAADSELKQDCLTDQACLEGELGAVAERTPASAEPVTTVDLAAVLAAAATPQTLPQTQAATPSTPDALPEPSLVDMAMNLAIMGDKQNKAKTEDVTQGEKVAHQPKTLSSAEFKLQVQASLLEQKLPPAAGALETLAGTKKDTETRFADLQGLGSALGTPARAPAVPLLSTAIRTPMGQPGWGAEVAEKVLWMSSQKIQSAEISINPPDLGPIEAKVQVQQDQVNVTFSTQHAPVKEALEQSLAKLKEMMAQNGVNLGSVDVRDQAQSQQGWTRHESNRGDGGSDIEPEEDAESTVKHVVTHRGLVDFYA